MTTFALDLAELGNTGKRDHGRPIYRLLRDLHYPPADRSRPAIVVRAGFETDLASVPRFLWRIAAPTDAIEASIIHDWLCRNRIGTRREADQIFLEAMEYYGVPRWRRRLMYRAVRLFGWTCYYRRPASITEKGKHNDD